MARNEILDEIHAARDALLAEHGGDVHAYVEAARKRALESGRTVVTSEQRTKDCTEAADSTVGAKRDLADRSGSPGALTVRPYRATDVIVG
jgi:hypothetical protein